MAELGMCTRYFVYLSQYTDAITTAVSYNAQGFEVGLHVNTNCDNFTPTSLGAFYVNRINCFQAGIRATCAHYPASPLYRMERLGYRRKVQLNHGIRLDTSYYFWPPSWVLNRPGIFSGSAMPMRFADLDGTDRCLQGDQPNDR